MSVSIGGPIVVNMSRTTNSNRRKLCQIFIETHDGNISTIMRIHDTKLYSSILETLESMLDTSTSDVMKILTMNYTT